MRKCLHIPSSLHGNISTYRPTDFSRSGASTVKAKQKSFPPKPIATTHSILRLQQHIGNYNLQRILSKDGDISSETSVYSKKILSLYNNHSSINLRVIQIPGANINLNRKENAALNKTAGIKRIYNYLETSGKILLLNITLNLLKLLNNYTEAPNSSAGKATKVTKKWKQKVWRYLKHPELYQRYKESGLNLRNLIIILIKWSREIVSSLNAQSLGITKKQLIRIKAFYYNLINTLSPYYTQMANLNLLWKGSRKAWRRTCNVTSMSMVLNALGINVTDFIGNRGIITRIAKHYLHNIKTFSDLIPLRMPDFLQLVVIYIYYQKSNIKIFNKRVKKARSAAAAIISKSLNVFKEIAKLFKVKEVARDFISSYGSQRHKILKQKKKIEKQYQNNKDDIKYIKEIAKINKKLNKLNNIYTAKKYKKRVLNSIRPYLNAGGQIIINRPGHYVRLESVDNKGITIDDPATRGKNFKISWAKANKAGYFRSYVVFNRS